MGLVGGDVFAVEEGGAAHAAAFVAGAHAEVVFADDLVRVAFGSACGLPSFADPVRVIELHPMNLPQPVTTAIHVQRYAHPSIQPVYRGDHRGIS